MQVDALPVARRPLLDRRDDQLGDVATADRQPFPEALEGQALGNGLKRNRLDLLGARKQPAKSRTPR